MKLRLCFLLFISVTFCYGQDDNLSQQVKFLKDKIHTTTKGEKLKWLDSLSTLTDANEDYQYTRNAQATIDFALSLDSFNLAVKNINFLVDYYNNIDNHPKLGLKVFKSFLGKATLLKNDNLLANYYLNGGDSSYLTDDIESALIYYERVQYYAKRSMNKKLLALSKMYIGIAHSDSGYFAESSIELQRAAAIFSDLKDTFNIISSKNALSILYSKNGFFDQAENEREEAIKLAVLKKSNSHLASFYHNAAVDAKKMGNPKKQLINLQLAYSYSQKSKYRKTQEPQILSTLIIAYAQNNNLVAAQSFLRKFENENYLNDTVNRSAYLDGLKHLAFARNNFQEALVLGQEHLKVKLETKNYEEIQDCEKFLSDVYTALENDSEAFIHFKNYYTIKDSILNQQKVQALGYYQTLYEIEKKDKTIKNQETDLQLLESKSRVQNQLLIFGGLGLILVFSLIILVRSRSNSKKREALQREFSQELISAQEHERTRVARELHDSVGQKLMLLTRKTKTSGDAEMQFLAGNTLEELRSISRGLHPSSLEKIGITAAVVSLVNEIDRNTNIFFTNEIENIDNCLTKETSLHLYRIIQEVLTNIVKHADAKAAFVTIKRQNNIIETTIADNGKGFEYSISNKNKPSLGMRTLLERSKIIKSRLEIISKPNGGTTIAITTPLN